MDIINSLFLKFKNKIVDKNYSNLVEKLRQECKERPLKIIFLNSELSKWSYQSLYEELSKNPKFELEIILTVKNTLLKNKYKFLDYKKSLETSYNYFKNKNMNVSFGFDFDKKKYLSLKQFNPDIIFYEQSGFVHKSQDIYATSKYALSFYCSYGSSTTKGRNEYDLGFLDKVYRYYLDNQSTKDFLLNYGFKKEQLVVSGALKLDAYRKEINLENKIWKTDKKRIIWAPHFSFFKGSVLNFGTFDWNYKFFLDYIKSHPEYEFIVKPHPDLKRQIVRIHFMTQGEVTRYFDELNSLENVQIFEGTSYFDMFRCSDLLITDSNSFLSEYLPTEKPVIHLINKNSVGFNEYGQKIVSGYYNAKNIDEIRDLIDKLLIKNDDNLLETRRNIIKNVLVHQQGSVASFIANDLISILGEE